MCPAQAHLLQMHAHHLGNLGSSRPMRQLIISDVTMTMTNKQAAMESPLVDNAETCMCRNASNTCAHAAMAMLQTLQDAAVAATTVRNTSDLPCSCHRWQVMGSSACCFIHILHLLNKSR